MQSGLRILFFIWFLLTAICVKSQNHIKTYQVAFQSAKLIHHTKKFAFESNGYSLFLDAKICAQTNGKKAWQQYYGYPRYGINLVFHDLGNPSILLGNAIGIYPFFDFGFLHRRKSSCRFVIGSGATYVFKPYNIKTNVAQNAIGTHWNNSATFQLKYEYNIYRKINLFFGIGLSHISNGGYAYPNLGLNYYSFIAGLGYNSNYARIKTLYNKHSQSKWSLSLIYGIAYREIKVVGGPKYPVRIFSLEPAFHYNNFKSIRTGIEIEYHFVSAYFAAHTELANDINSAFKAGLRLQGFVGHEWLIGPVSIELRIGYQFLKSSIYAGYPLYNKFVIQYHLPITLAKYFKVQTGIALKTQYGVAEYISINSGIRLKNYRLIKT